jgi:hypothetical protein
MRDFGCGEALDGVIDFVKDIQLETAWNEDTNTSSSGPSSPIFIVRRANVWRLLVGTYHVTFLFDGLFLQREVIYHPNVFSSRQS